MKQHWFGIICISCVVLVVSISCGVPPGEGGELWVLDGGGGESRQEISSEKAPVEAPVGREEPVFDTAAPDASAPDTAASDAGRDEVVLPEERESHVTEREPPADRPATCQEGVGRCVEGQSQTCKAGAWGDRVPCAQDEECKGEGHCVSTLPPPNPCAGKCWPNAASLVSCGFFSKQEDFQTGNYNVHQYNTSLRANVPMLLSLTNIAGVWQPALYITLKDGTPLTPVGRGPASVKVRQIQSGRTGQFAQWSIEASTDQEIIVYVTGWKVIDSKFVDFLPKTAVYGFLLQENCPGTSGGFAPPGAQQGEQLVQAGVVTVKPSAQYGTPYRIDAQKGEHISFRLDFRAGAGVTMALFAWVGQKAKPLGDTNWGPDLRVLAALDTQEKRTFWVQVKGLTQDATLQISRTPFVDGTRCTSDCDRLLQLPLPMEPKTDGYFTHPDGKFAYQFGRRDLLMALRHAGKTLVAAGYPPFPLKDYSKWDGSTPPGHASHKNGEDVDIAVFEKKTGPVWKPMCNVDSQTNCIKGSDFGFDGEGMAVLLQGFLETERIVYVFLDQQFIPLVIAGAEARIKAGQMKASLLPLFKKAVSHWPNHHNHAHVRIEDKPYP